MSDYLNSLELDSALRESLCGVVDVSEDLIDNFDRHSNDEYLIGLVEQSKLLIRMIDGEGISAYGWDEYYKGIIVEPGVSERQKLGRCRLMDFATLQKTIQDIFDGYIEDINRIHSTTNSIFKTVSERVQAEWRKEKSEKKLPFKVSLGDALVEYKFSDN